MKQATKTTLTLTLPSKRILFVVGLLAIMLISATTWVFAQGVDDGLIHACVSEPGSNSQSQNMQGQGNTGSVRIVDDSLTDCSTGESPLTWPSANDGDTLAGLFCANGEIAKWNGDAWACDADVDTDTNLDQAGVEALGFFTDPHTTELDWTSVLNRPAGLDDGDDNTQLTEVEVEGFVTNAPLDLAAGTTLGGSPIATHPQNVIVVAQSGGGFAGVQAALDSITDAAPDNRYLVEVMPGTYTERVTMKAYVDIEGSGEGVTVIACACGSDTDPGVDASSATLIGAANSELRFVTVKNTGGKAFSIGIYGANSFSMLHITVEASGGSAANYGVYNEFASPRMTHVTAIASGGNNNFGMYNVNSSPRMTHVTAIASGGSRDNYGVRNIGSSSPEMTHVTATASGGSRDNFGMHNELNSSPTIENSVVGGSTAGIVNVFNSTAKVANTRIMGGVSGVGFTCVNTYDGSFAALGTNCT